MNDVFYPEMRLWAKIQASRVADPALCSHNKIEDDSEIKIHCPECGTIWIWVQKGETSDVGIWERRN